MEVVKKVNGVKFIPEYWQKQYYASDIGRRDEIILTILSDLGFQSSHAQAWLSKGGSEIEVTFMPYDLAVHSYSISITIENKRKTKSYPNKPQGAHWLDLLDNIRDTWKDTINE
jgi:hypothetical protein